MNPKATASLENSLPPPNFVKDLGLIIEKIIEKGGWKFTCQMEDEQGNQVYTPVDAKLLSDPQQLMPVVLHQANYIFNEAYGQQAPIAYRLNTQGGGAAGAVPEFEPGVSTAGPVLWGLVMLEAFESLASEAKAHPEWQGQLNLEGWWHQWEMSLNGAFESRPIQLLEAHPQPGAVSLSPRTRPQGSSQIGA